MTTIAVTAASGKLGSEVLRAVSRLETHSVIGLARTPAKAEHLGVEVRSGDYNSPVELERSLESVETLLLVSGMDEPDRRIEQHRNVIRAAQAAGVRKLVGDRDRVLSGCAEQSPNGTGRSGQRPGLGGRSEWHLHRTGCGVHRDVQAGGVHRELRG